MSLSSTSFKPGESGNPAGRPVGATSERHKLIKMFDEAAPDLVKKSIEIAKTGDSAMMRTCLERIFPKKREETYVKIEDFAHKGYEHQAKVLDQGLENNTISAEIWELMHKTISRKFEIEEIDRRLSMLEKAQEEKNNG